ncbi:ATP-dependent nuclease [Glutamicibacter sp. NPDC087673]|uniref:ATP-dependent nuclease n=1 Tax=Glutamicibacter sp. NPDC087673 TaxID=3363997 RepID=UPI003806608B
MNIHDKIKNELKKGNYEPYLRHIRFPLYKNITPNTKIEFTHPITAIVGPNGASKTSILRAIEACPDQVSLGNYWFTTSLDPISPSQRYRYIHGYNAGSNRLVESVKSRISRTGNPDIWEPSRPLTGPDDQMERMPDIGDTEEADLDFRVKTRWKAIDKNVKYIDFRKDIPAFDLFYHFNYNGKYETTLKRKDFLRTRAEKVSKIFDENLSNFIYYKLERVVERPVTFSAEEVAAIEKILQKKYSQIDSLKHSLYGMEGHTIRLHSPNQDYTEAFAGSGEYAVVMLVREIISAPKNSLIILDEPEVSLHPGAQHKLMEFISQQCVKNKIQFVLATHSNEIIRDLPSDAIKVLSNNPATNLTELLSQSCVPDEAFRVLGLDVPSKVIYVEDKLAQAIVEFAIKCIGPGYGKAEVRPLGGADSIMGKFVPLLARSNNKSLVILDGDQEKFILNSSTEEYYVGLDTSEDFVQPEHVSTNTHACTSDCDIMKSIEWVSTWPREPHEIPANLKRLPRKLDELSDSKVELELSRLSITNSLLTFSGGAQGKRESLTNGKEIIQWIRSNVKYLPFQTPEIFLAEAAFNIKSLNRENFANKSNKDIWVKRALDIFIDRTAEDLSSEDILSAQRMHIRDVKDTKEFFDLMETIKEFLS